MKIVFFTTYYAKYIDFFYKTNLGLEKKSYDEQIETIESDFFSPFATYKYECKIFDCEAYLIIPNCKPLQKKWAEENNISFNELTWRFSIPIHQINKIKPDIFFISSMFEYYGSFLDEVKKNVKKIFGWISCPIPKGIFKKSHPELILSSAPHLVDTFKQIGVNSEYLNASFDTRIIEAVKKQKQKLIFNNGANTHDFTFIGGISPAHKKRINDLSYLAKKSSISFFGYGYTELNKSNLIKKLFFKNELLPYYKGEAWGLNMFRLLFESKITFNSHIDIANGFGVNMRMYEATGMGTLLLTDGKGKNQLFDDNEVIYYSDIEDAIEKVNYYLTNEEERKAIALAGQKKTLQNYNSRKAVESMLNFFNHYM